MSILSELRDKLAAYDNADVDHSVDDVEAGDLGRFDEAQADMNEHMVYQASFLAEAVRNLLGALGEPKVELITHAGDYGYDADYLFVDGASVRFKAVGIDPRSCEARTYDDWLQEGEARAAGLTSAAAEKVMKTYRSYKDLPAFGPDS